MEERLICDASRRSKLTPKFTAAVLSLITNPFTSDEALLSLSETLVLHLRDANCNHRIILSLLYTICHQYPRLRHRIAAGVQVFIYSPSTATSTLPHALALLDPGDSTPNVPFVDESLFLAICFWHSVKTRRWALRNMCKFRMRPSVLLTVLLGLTKDPYPYVREAALDGLVMISSAVMVDDRSLIEVSYFRAVELLFDAENSIRGAAVRAVCKWGELLVALNPDKTNGDWPDALFVQLCVMARDPAMEIRVATFNALGNIQTVSEDLLLQTLSKKALAATKEKDYPGQYTAKLFKIPATAVAFTFLHGLEDEFYQVRTSACRALQMVSVHSAKFAGEAVHRLMDMLNDDAMFVRLQALVTLYHIAVREHLRVEEPHLHMLLGALRDNESLVRSAARKTLQLTKLRKLEMLRSSMDGLIKNLELYPQDEADIFHVIYKIGQTHGKFVTTIVHQVSDELEPSSNGKLGPNKVREAALLVLAISAPVSLERKICSIPPQIYSYAVTLLGRLSRGLVDITDQNSLLAYLSQCSRFSIASSSENLEATIQSFHFQDCHVQLLKTNDGFPSPSLESLELKTVTSPLHDHLLNINAAGFIEVLLQKIVDFWPLIQLGSLNVVVRTLRSWKQELRKFSCDSHKLSSVMNFTLKYLHVIKMLARAWAYYFCQKSHHFKGMRVLDAPLGKMEKGLKELLYRYVGLSGQEKLHILELMLVTYTLKVSGGGICSFDDCMGKLNLLLSHVEYLRKEESLGLSDFLIELQNIRSGDIGNSKDGCIDKVHLLQKSLSLFSLKYIVLSKDLKYLDAEVDVCNNDFQNPYPFVPRLPVGIPIDITLYNISNEVRLWLAISLGENLSQFVFLNLDEFENFSDIRRFSFVAPFYRTPEVKHFSLKVSIAMECLLEDRFPEFYIGPKHKLIHLCKGKEVHLSVAVK